jgi:two-component system CheB/CheR fusion protein
MIDITERRLAEKVSQEARIYAESIIDTVREPFVILDKDLEVLSANRSFYSTFEVTPDETVWNLIYDIGDRQWDIPRLRELLEKIIPMNTQFHDFEIEQEFHTIGLKAMLLNASRLKLAESDLILLAIEDITEQKNL